MFIHRFIFMLFPTFILISFAHAQTIIKPTLIDVDNIEGLPVTSSLGDTKNHHFVRPSVTSSNVGRGEQTIEFYFACVDLRTGQYLPNITAHIVGLETVEKSGGHNHHDDSRPTGYFYPLSGNTGHMKYWSTTYTSPEISGAIESEMYCDPPPDYISIPYVFTIDVEIPELIELPANDNYSLVGGYGSPGVNSQHIYNHFGKQTLHAAITKLANKYAEKHPGYKISINDISLPKGGLFDIGNKWTKPHSSHRFGEDVDIRPVPTEHQAEFQKLLGEMEFSVILNEGNHLHIRL